MMTADVCMVDGYYGISRLRVATAEEIIECSITQGGPQNIAPSFSIEFSVTLEIML